MSSTELLVNLGCGQRYHPDWLNLDLASSSPHVVQCDLTQGIPVADGTAAMVYSAAVLEHIPRAFVQGFLGECFRILRPGGLIRIAVPDFEFQAQEYLRLLQAERAGEQVAQLREWMILVIADQFGRDCPGGEMLGFLRGCSQASVAFVQERFGEEAADLFRWMSRCEGSTISHPVASPARIRLGRVGQFLLRLLVPGFRGQSDLLAWQIGRFRLFSGELHRWLYDDCSLGQVISTAGFVGVNRRQHGQSDLPRWEHYRLEVDERGSVRKPDLFVMEARKP